jgi:GH24 family phage-related lysozyme (muramidase)
MSFELNIINDDDLQLAEMTLNDDEAFVPTPYQDTRGNWTVGYGINLHVTDMPREVALLWMQLLVREIRNWLSQEFGYFERISDVRKAVLINMTYHMGQGGIREFEKMHMALMVGDIPEAIKEMKDSQWYRNHKLRADRLIYMMQFEQYCSRQHAKSYYTNQ